MAADYIIALRPREWSVDGLGKAIAEVTKIPVCDQQLVPDTSWKKQPNEPNEMMSKHPLDYYDIKPGSKMNDNPGSRSNIVSVPSSCAMAIS